jgi:hypothetical protein
MKEYICKEEPTDTGGYLEIETELIRCRDCENWKPTETDEEIGECVILNKVVCFSCRTVANYYCAMAQPKDKKNETES